MGGNTCGNSEAILSCAITMALDGREDNKIHCFKPGQPCESGRQELQWQNATVEDSDTEDPFASEDEEEGKKNEICTDDDLPEGNPSSDSESDYEDS